MRIAEVHNHWSRCVVHFVTLDVRNVFNSARYVLWALAYTFKIPVYPLRMVNSYLEVDDVMYDKFEGQRQFLPRPELPRDIGTRSLEWILKQYIENRHRRWRPTVLATLMTYPCSLPQENSRWHNSDLDWNNFKRGVDSRLKIIRSVTTSLRLSLTNLHGTRDRFPIQKKHKKEHLKW